MSIKEFHEFLNKDSTLDPVMEDLSISKLEEVNLNHLTDELIQVFCFENIDKSMDAQKEELIHVRVNN